MARAGDSPFSATIDATSLKRVEYAIGKTKERIVEETKAAVKEVAEAAVVNAQRNAPVDSGALRDGISAVFSDDDLSAEVGPHDPKTWYAILVEWGDSQRPAHPFMTPAGEIARAALHKSLIEHVNHATGEAGV